MDHNELFVFAGILALAAVAGLVANRLEQPVVIAFIGVGILVGPVGTGWVVEAEPDPDPASGEGGTAS